MRAVRSGIPPSLYPFVEQLVKRGRYERRVKLDDCPWGGKWCLRFEAASARFVPMAVLMAATGAPKYETNSNHEIEGACTHRFQADAKACCDKAAAGAPGTWGAWLPRDVLGDGSGRAVGPASIYRPVHRPDGVPGVDVMRER